MDKVVAVSMAQYFAVPSNVAGTSLGNNRIGEKKVPLTKRLMTK